MKVGILTLPLWHNYGGILQAYALRSAIGNLGHDAVLLDVHRPVVDRTTLRMMRLKRALRRVVRGRSAPWYPDACEVITISRNTRLFVENRIHPKTEFIPVDHLADLLDQFDAIVVGSDQVWRREYMPDLATYFLAFSGHSPRRISYAASLGVDHWRFNPGETQFIVRNLNQFHAISVREDSAVAMLSALGIQTSRVCDPTFFFEAEHYCRLANVAAKGGDSRLIFTYVLDETARTAGALESLVLESDGEAFTIMPKPFGPGFRTTLEEYFFPPVEAWLRAFNDCGFVITDSFHGCVFSLIFNRPFVAVANEERGKARFEALLGRYGLTDRLFSSLADIDIKSLAPIDWESVNRTRAEEKGHGLAFLVAALMQEDAL
jgi:hypothetical protein